MICSRWRDSGQGTGRAGSSSLCRLARTYVPDVVVELGDGRRFVTAVAAAGRMAFADNVRMYRALRGTCEAVGHIRLITDTHVSIQNLFSRRADGEVEAAVLDAVTAAA